MLLRGVAGELADLAEANPATPAGSGKPKTEVKLEEETTAPTSGATPGVADTPAGEAEDKEAKSESDSYTSEDPPPDVDDAELARIVASRAKDPRPPEARTRTGVIGLRPVPKAESKSAARPVTPDRRELERHHEEELRRSRSPSGRGRRGEDREERPPIERRRPGPQGRKKSKGKAHRERGRQFKKKQRQWSQNRW